MIETCFSQLARKNSRRRAIVSDCIARRVEEQNAVCVRAWGGGLSAAGEFDAALVLVNRFDVLLAYPHHHHHNYCLHCSHHRHHHCRLQGGFVRYWRVVPATTATAPMIPAVPAGACQDEGGV